MNNIKPDIPAQLITKIWNLTTNRLDPMVRTRIFGSIECRIDIIMFTQTLLIQQKLENLCHAN